jgi:hypothetical protein
VPGRPAASTWSYRHQTDATGRIGVDSSWLDTGRLDTGRLDSRGVDTGGVDSRGVDTGRVEGSRLDRRTRTTNPG